MQDVRAGAGQLGRIEHVVDRGLLSGGWARGEEAGVIPSGGRRGVIDGLRVFGVHDEQAVERRQFLHGCEQLLPGQRRELRHPGIQQERLEPEDPGVVQLPQRTQAGGNGTAPEADVDEAVVLCGFLLGPQSRYVDGGWDAVQRHVDEGGDPACGSRPGSRGKALPVGAAGFVDVHMRVHQAGQQHLIVGELHSLGAVRCGVVAEHVGNLTVADRYRTAPLEAVDDGPRRPDEQVVDAHCRTPTSLRSLTGAPGTPATTPAH